VFSCLLYRLQKKRLGSILTFSSFFTEKRVRTVLAAAAGLIIGFVLYPFLVQKPGTQYEQHQIDLSGTIGIGEGFPVEEIQSIDIQLNDIQGSIDLKQAENLVWVEFNLVPEDDMSAQLMYDDQILEFIVFQPLDPARINFQHQSKRINVNTSQPFILIFSQIVNQFSTLNVLVKSNTGKEQRAVLSVKASEM